MQRIILASQSKQRKMMMALSGLPFDTIPADIDEKAIRSDDPKIQAESIAKAKIEKISAEYDGVIIAGDLFLCLDNKILEKPTDLNEARDMMYMLSGATVHVYCGFAYFDTSKNIKTATCVVTELIFRTFSDAEIDEYLKTYPVLSWAAGYAPLDYGITMIKEIRGSYTGIHGLPLEILIPLLRQSGFEPKPHDS